MKTKQSGATFSTIVGIGARIKKLSGETGKEYLFLNRGVNAVTHINLKEVVKIIDFNSSTLQVYPPNKGMPELIKAVNDEYFKGNADAEKIFIVPGGMPALDLVIQTLDIEKLYHARYFWGSCRKVARIRNVATGTYETLHELNEKLRKTKERPAVLICDPNNPVGNKIPDNYLYEQIRSLNEKGVVVIFDSPYRRLFIQDDFFYRLSRLENVIITESFSKSLGLSGQRLGFVHSSNDAFSEELNIRLLYSFNGVNAFAQQLVCLLLTSPEGKNAVQEFRDTTVKDIKNNILYLEEKGFLYRNFYRNSMPVGIFVVVDVSENELLKYNIGSVSMMYFSKEKDELVSRLSRICVSVPHAKLVSFFNRIYNDKTTGIPA